MAPEIIQLDGPCTASDIWSLGCVMIEMMTGNPPYASLNPMSAMFHIVQDPFMPIPGFISDSGKDFLDKCLQKDPFQRWNASQLLQHPWIRLKTPVELKWDAVFSNDQENKLLHTQKHLAKRRRRWTQEMDQAQKMGLYDLSSLDRQPKTLDRKSKKKRCLVN
jgi:serine/threonine protein kinase